MDNALKKIYQAVFNIFEKALTIKNCAKFIMAMRKSLVIEIRKTQTNKTFLVSDFKFHQATRKCFRNLFEIKHAEIFPSCVLDIHRNFRNWHQLFYNRSGSYKIHALPVSSFLVYRFHGNIDYLENLIQPNFNS